MSSQLKQIERPDHRLYRAFGKRGFDVAASFVGLLVLGLPMLLIAVVSWISQGLPILFRQERVGRQGSRFTVLKYRTMVVFGGDDNPVTVAGDFRVTRWGSILRRFKLDELPQLICVLFGKMSLVGPRPDVPGYVDKLQGQDVEVANLKPGITGPATLVFRGEERLLAQVADARVFNDTVLFPEKVRLNRRYFREQSFASDLKWIVYTILPEPILQRRLAAEGWTTTAMETSRRGCDGGV